MQCYATLFKPSTEGRKHKKPKIAQPAYTAGVNEIKIAHTTQQMVIQFPIGRRTRSKELEKPSETTQKLKFYFSGLLFARRQTFTKIFTHRRDQPHKNLEIFNFFLSSSLDVQNLRKFWVELDNRFNYIL